MDMRWIMGEKVVYYKMAIWGRIFFWIVLRMHIISRNREMGDGMMIIDNKYN